MLGLTLMLGLWEGEMLELADGEMLTDGLWLGDADGLTLILGLWLGETLTLGD